MLGVSFRHRGDELVAMPHTIDEYRAGHTTGIPLLHPWANRLGSRHYRTAGVDVDLEGLELHTDPLGLPIHGTITGDSGWVVVERSETALSATLDFARRPDLLASFPFPHEVTVAVALTPVSLAVSTAVHATGERPVPVSLGWHPYLRLPRVRRRSWRLRLPDRDHVELDHRNVPTGRSSAEPGELAPLGDRAFDDHYALGDDRRLAISGGGRTVWLWLAEGYGHAQVYAPPGERFVCLEPMTAPINALVDGMCPVVEPGRSFEARFEITVGATTREAAA
jgi:galactose mutarotase-like enzyme